jgi:transposase
MAKFSALDLPDDVASLKAHISELELALAERDATIESLHAQVRMSLARRFGGSRERTSQAQLGLLNEAEALDASAEPVNGSDEPPAGEAITVPAHQRRRGKRAPLPANLPRVDVVHTLGDDERRCPHDGTEIEVFDEQTSEQLDIVPAKIQVLHQRRLKYRCACCREHLVTAPMPAQPLPKSQASPGLLAYVATAKFVDALPLYRQSKQFERIKAPIPKQTLARWMVRCGQNVQPRINLLRDELLRQTYIHVDETTLQVLKEPGREAQSKSYMWVQVSGERERPIVLFDYHPSRVGEVPKRLLDGFTGALHTDGYTGYNAVVRDNQSASGNSTRARSSTSSING